MSQFVTDTHPLIWHLTGDVRLTSDARTVFTLISKDQRIQLSGLVTLIW